MRGRFSIAILALCFFPFLPESISAKQLTRAATNGLSDASLERSISGNYTDFFTHSVTEIPEEQYASD